MLKIYKKAMEGVKKLGFWDRAVLKIYLVVWGLLLATIIPALTTVKWWIYAIIVIIGGIYISTKIFKKK